MWILLPGAVFYFLRGNSYIYGDGHLILHHISRDQIISKTAYGLSLLIKFIYSTLGIGKWIEPADIMTWVSIFCGILFIFFLYKILEMLIASDALRIIFFLVCATSAMVVLFTGYIETYSVLTAWLAVYIYTAIKYLRGKTGTPLLILIYAIGIFWHIWFIAFLPSLIFLVNRRFKLLPEKIVMLLSAVLVIGIYTGGRIMTRSGIPAALPLVNNSDTDYSMVSPQHLLDFLNILVFIGPAVGVLGIILLLAYIGRVKTGISRMLTYLLIPAVIFSFFIDPALGASRDWDLLSIFALPAALTVAAIISRTDKPDADYRFLMIPLLILGVIHTGLFIAINKNQQSAVDRMIVLLKQDTHYTDDYYNGERIIPFVSILSNIYHRNDDAASFTERKVASAARDYADLKHLGDLYYNQDEYEKALEYYQQVPPEFMSQLDDRMSYANSLYQTGRLDEAWEAMKQVARDTSFLSLYFRMGNIKLMTGNADSAVLIYKQGLSLTPDTSAYLDNAAGNLFAYAEYAHAADFYRLGYAHDPENPELATSLGRSLQKLGDLDSADYYFKDVLKDHPDNYGALMGLSILLHEKQDFDSSLQVLSTAEQFHPRDFGIQHWYGNNYRSLGRHNEALRAYQIALSLYPNHVPTRHYAALELFKAGDLRTALEQWNHVLTLDSTHTGALLGIARVHDSLNNNTEAYKTLLLLQKTGFDLQSDSTARKLSEKYLNAE